MILINNTSDGVYKKDSSNLRNNHLSAVCEVSNREPLKEKKVISRPISNHIGHSRGGGGGLKRNESSSTRGIGRGEANGWFREEGGGG